MRLIQFETSAGLRHVGVIEGDLIQVVRATTHMRELALAAGMCGSVSGSVPTSVGQPALKVDKILVGGNA